MTHSFLSCAVQRIPFSFQMAHPPCPRFSSISCFYSGSMMRRASPTAISSREGPPAHRGHRELALDALPSSSIEKHCVLPPICCWMLPLSFPSTYYLSVTPHNTLSARWQSIWKSSTPTPLTGARYVTRNHRNQPLRDMPRPPNLLSADSGTTNAARDMPLFTTTKGVLILPQLRYVQVRQMV